MDQKSTELKDRRIRKKKHVSQEVKNRFNKSLDGEILTSTINRVKLEVNETFMCFRCNSEKVSRSKYEWITSEGLKIICNGCNGNLIAHKGNLTKASEPKQIEEKQNHKKRRLNARNSNNPNKSRKSISNENENQ